MQTDQAQVDDAEAQPRPTRRIVAPVDRPGRPAPGRSRQLRAAPATPTASCVITQLQPITVHLHPARGQRCRRCCERLRAGATLAGRRPSTATQTTKLGHRHARHRRQPDRHDDRHGQAARAASTTPTRRCSPTSSSTSGCWSTRCTDAAVVPVAAIQRGAPGTFVYLVKADDTVDDPRRSRLGADRRRDDRRSPRASQAGEQVVTDGADRLRDGAKIRRPARRPAAGAAAGAAAPPRRRAARPRRAGPARSGGASGQRRRSGAAAAQPARADRPVTPAAT